MSKDIQYPRLTLLYLDHWAEDQPASACSLSILISDICCPRGRNTLPDRVSAHVHTTMHCPLVTVLVCGYGVNLGLICAAEMLYQCMLSMLGGGLKTSAEISLTSDSLLAV